MSNESYTLDNGNKLHTIAGMWFDDDGYQVSLASRYMVVEVDPKGRLTDPEYGWRIRREADGHLQGDGCCNTFVPEAGELARIGARF